MRTKLERHKARGPQLSSSPSSKLVVNRNAANAIAQTISHVIKLTRSLSKPSSHAMKSLHLLMAVPGTAQTIGRDNWSGSYLRPYRQGAAVR